jgi:ABC-type branched-subunit amino acid transport system permease subunit
VLGYLPFAVYADTANLLVDSFLLLIMASMWNLLAGYAGLVSVGQQAFIGLGAYCVVILASHGTSPFLAIPVATIATGAAGLLVWWLVSRRGGTGIALQGLNLSPKLLNAYTYWAALAVTVVVLAAVYALLRSRLGLALTAIRDDETGARSIGARVSPVQRLVFIVAAAGCGAAGAIYAISQQLIVPSAAFSVDFSAQLIFITIIGGIGTIEGPIIGTVVFFVLQQTLSQYGAWYLIVLGPVAMAVAIWAPRGLWGLISDRLGIRLFPVGYYLWPAGEHRRPWLRPGRRG